MICYNASMKRILLFCKYDWEDASAGAVEHHAHEVFRRIAAQGHSVTWMARRPLTDKKAIRQRIETKNSLQVVRLGWGLFYRQMMAMFLTRLLNTRCMADYYHVIIDCVTHTPLALNAHDALPIVPLVYRLHHNVRIAEKLPKFFLAVDEQVHQQLRNSGVPPEHIILLPYAIDTSVYSPAEYRAAQPRIAAAVRYRKTLRQALRILRGNGTNPSVDWMTTRIWRPRPHGRDYQCPLEAHRIRIYQQARIGYCAEGMEQEALKMAACATPPICPDTPLGREYVQNEENGLLYQPGNPQHLAQCLQRLLTDDALWQHLSNQARKNAITRTWDKTASRMLDALESL